MNFKELPTKFKDVLEKYADTKQKQIALVAAIVLVLLLIVCGLVYNSGLGAVDSKNDELIVVEIPNGTGGSMIIEILDENGLIKNKTCAKIHMKIGGYDSLQANNYVFSKDMPLKEILKAINTGDFSYLSKNVITIIEGATIPEAAEAVGTKVGFTKEDVIKVWSDKNYLNELIEEYWFITEDILNPSIMFPLEGYIYPETYFVTDTEPTIESITKMFLDKTDEVLTARKDKIEASGMDVHKFLTLASVVQAESLFKNDIPTIAGVFVNRLEVGMPLQSDITVLYALQEKRVDVTYADLEVDSPYNTYKYAGLPVGPVCSVPSYTLDAVLDYEKSDYLYFFATKDGKVLYSKTLAEHEKTVNENLWY